jgi:hypothetical protein
MKEEKNEQRERKKNKIFHVKTTFSFHFFKLLQGLIHFKSLSNQFCSFIAVICWREKKNKEISFSLSVVVWIFQTK